MKARNADNRSISKLVEAKGPRVLRPSVAQSARSLIEAIDFNESATPTEGIYFIIRYPDIWQLFAYRFDDFPLEIDHSQLWEDHVAPILAAHWSRRLKMSADRLEDALRLHAYGFPRGRITRAPGKPKFNVLHGNDLAKFMGTSPSTIERAFSVTGIAQWVRDEHEQCQSDDRDAVRQILRLKETWKAV